MWYYIISRLEKTGVTVTNITVLKVAQHSVQLVLFLKIKTSFNYIQPLSK